MRKNPRSKFFPADKRDLWRPPKDYFDVPAHERTHREVEFLYTSTATLSTTISTPWRPKLDYQIVWAKGDVAGAPSGADLVWDVLVSGVSIFTNTAERVRVEDGETEGIPTYPSRPFLPARSKLQFQGVTLSGATGPIVITLGLAVAQ